MKTKPWAIAIVICFTFLISAAQILFKLGANQPSIINWQLFLGLALYGISTVLLLIAFRGGELSVLYPLIALSYVWVALILPWFTNEAMNQTKWLGILSIIIGVALIGRGSK
ncbi:MAG: 4-amino-4-deoxy-L-arabinose-phospho-UDP flippase [Candidatus Woesearchaeota archaeon]